MEVHFNAPVETRVSKNAANAAYIVLWEFVSQGGNIPGIDRELVVEFTSALGTANTIVIED